MFAGAVKARLPRMSVGKRTKSMEVIDPTERQLELKQLLSAVATARDVAAFETLYMHFLPRLRSHMRKLTKDVVAADELSQEVMLSVWRKADQFDPQKGQVSTWIFTIARNLYIDALRRRVPQFDENDPAFVPDAERPADELMITAENTAALTDALGKLKGEYLAVLRMSYFEEMPHAAISSALGIPLGTVKSRIRLACEKLRWALQETGK